MKKIKFLTLGALATVTPVAMLISCQSTVQETASQTTESKTSDFNSPESVIYNQRWLSNVWNTVSAEKTAMSQNLYNAAKKQFDAMITQSQFDTKKFTFMMIKL